MNAPPNRPPRFLVMAKPPVPGRVKTRLTPTLSPDQAAAVQAAMLAALITRLGRFVEAGDAELVLALAVPGPPGAALPRQATLEQHFAGHPADLHALLAVDLHVVAQGPGELGQRIAGTWPADLPAVVLGADSPDLPKSHLLAALRVAHPTAAASCPAGHQSPGAALGPTGDGGYWTLAAPRRRDALLGRPPHPPIDWGTPAVYDQSHHAARAAGLSLVDLPHWHDTDTPDDLDQLRARLAPSDDPALQQLADQLQRITA